MMCVCTDFSDLSDSYATEMVNYIAITWTGFCL